MTELNLFEGSGLQFFAANENTPITGIKSQKDIFEMSQKLEKALKHGKYTDESMQEIQTKYNELSQAIKDAEVQKEEMATKEIETKSIRERIELKGYTYDQYAVLSMDKKETLGFLDSIEYGFKAIARNCGEGLISDNTATMATEFLTHCKDAIAKLESYEDQILNGTGIMETEESITMDGEKSFTDPLKGSQPKEAEPLKNIFTKSQLLEIENIFN